MQGTGYQISKHSVLGKKQPDIGEGSSLMCPSWQENDEIKKKSDGQQKQSDWSSSGVNSMMPLPRLATE